MMAVQDAVRVILEEVKQMAKKIGENTYADGNRFKFADTQAREMNLHYASKRKPFEHQLVILIMTLGKFKLSPEDKAEIKKVIKEIYDNWTDTFDDALKDFFYLLKKDFKDQGNMEILNGIDPDEQAPGTAKEFLRGTLNALQQF